MEAKDEEMLAKLLQKKKEEALEQAKARGADKWEGDVFYPGKFPVYVYGCGDDFSLYLCYECQGFFDSGIDHDCTKGGA